MDETAPAEATTTLAADEPQWPVVVRSRVGERVVPMALGIAALTTVLVGVLMGGVLGVAVGCIALALVVVTFRSVFLRSVVVDRDAVTVTDRVPARRVPWSDIRDVALGSVTRWSTDRDTGSSTRRTTRTLDLTVAGRRAPVRANISGFDEAQLVAVLAIAAKGAGAEVAPKLATRTTAPFDPAGLAPPTRFTDGFARFGMPIAAGLFVVGLLALVSTFTVLADDDTASGRQEAIDRWLATQPLAEGVTGEEEGCEPAGEVGGRAQLRCAIRFQVAGNPTTRLHTVVLVEDTDGGYDVQPGDVIEPAARRYPVSRAGLDRVVARDLPSGTSCDLTTLAAEDELTVLSGDPVELSCRGRDGAFTATLDPYRRIIETTG